MLFLCRRTVAVFDFDQIAGSPVPSGARSSRSRAGDALAMAAATMRRGRWCGPVSPVSLARRRLRSPASGHYASRGAWGSAATVLAAGGLGKELCVRLISSPTLGRKAARLPLLGSASGPAEDQRPRRWRCMPRKPAEPWSRESEFVTQVSDARSRLRFHGAALNAWLMLRCPSPKVGGHEQR